MYSCVVQGATAPGRPCVHIGVALGQGHNGRGVAGCGCKMKRCFLIVVLYIHVDAGFDEGCDGVDVALLSGNVQRSKALVISSERTRAVPEQGYDGRGLTEFGCCVKRRFFVVVLDICVSTCVNQDVDDCNVALLSGNVQRCRAIAIPQGRIRVTREEGSDSPGMVILGSGVEGCFPVSVLCVRISTTGKEEFCHFYMAVLGSGVQERPSAFVPCIWIRARCKEGGEGEGVTFRAMVNKKLFRLSSLGFVPAASKETMIST